MVKSIRAALTGVLRSAPPGQQPRVLVVTSASEGEGKTTIACNFALTLAQVRQRVLLIDAHLDRPRLHSLFDVPNRQGFSDVLEDLASQLNSSFRETCASLGMASRHVAGLRVLPSGTGSGSVVNRLYSAELPGLFASLRKEYDYIVVDTAPLSVEYSRPLVRQADGVVLVVGSCQTPQDTALAWVRRLEADGARSVGTVLNDCEFGLCQTT
jgi:capsular exopolysaccharide synthesis family protein